MDIAEASGIISSSDNFLILTHQNPDGDAIGSSLGMLLTLRANGKRADAYFHEPLPEAYSRLPIPDIVVETLPFLSEYDTTVCLDFSNPKRFGDIDFSILNSINIDHHPDNSCFAVKNYVCPTASATAEIVYNIIKNIPGWSIPRDAASFLMTGLVMDTGGFRFDNTSSNSFRVAADLLDIGSDYSSIIKFMFLSKPGKLASLEAELVLHHIKTACNGAFAWVYLSDEILDRYAIREKDTEGLIDSIRSIRDFDIVAVIRRKDEGFRFSLRSKNRQYSAGRIARALNGGGHEMAAGGLILASSLEAAEKIMAEHVARELSRL